MRSSNRAMRWHDKRPELSQSVRMMSALPYDLQSIIGTSVSQMAVSQFDADRAIRSLKSLGSEKVLGLYKSLKKRRNYDKNPELRQAINYLYS